MKRLLLSICVILVLNCAIGLAKCRVYESTWDEYESVVLENDLIRVTILPAGDGSITEYYFKDGKFNAFLPVEFSSFFLFGDDSIVDTNFGGYKDWSKQTGVLKSKRNYDYRIIKNTPESAAVELVYLSDVKLERIVTIYDQSTLVDITLRVTNITGKAIQYTPWAHTLVTPAGKVDNSELLYIPVGANLISRATSYSHCFLSDIDTVHKEVNTPIKSGMRTFKPKQGWRGILSPVEKALLGEVVDVELLGDDGYFDFWKAQEEVGGDTGHPTSRLSLETIFSKSVIEPDETLEIKFAFVQTLGLSGLSYLGRNVCLYLCKDEISSGEEPVVVEVNSPIHLQDCELECIVSDEKGNQIASLGKKVVSLDPTSVRTIEFETSELKIASGSYGIGFILSDSSGQRLEEASILGAKLVVK